MLPTTYDEWLALTDAEREDVKRRHWNAKRGDGIAFAYMAAARLALQCPYKVAQIGVNNYLGGEYLLSLTVSRDDFAKCPPMVDQSFEGFRVVWAPEKNLGVQGDLDQCSLLLRFLGDDLEPNSITALLGVPATIAVRKGEPVRGRTMQTGCWLLDCEITADSVDDQIRLLFGDLTEDFEIWKSLAANYSAELKVHLFLKEWNSGAIMSADVIAAIAARRLKLVLDVYCRDPLPRGYSEGPTPPD